MNYSMTSGPCDSDRRIRCAHISSLQSERLVLTLATYRHLGSPQRVTLVVDADNKALYVWDEKAAAPLLTHSHRTFRPTAPSEYAWARLTDRDPPFSRLAMGRSP